ncbi:PREDICTED: homologous-pairing protein 2 homolog [Vollenhovia emeryi]|uniref:homologous-pairing protein 2 homolog n=1 Tax=Vollenhovia emeryi TaxID=411798 RepID=UPI0005F5010A|nr:PREDICTED: homologous-pairing protein 2 homolog [Vollenhovia emeryi]XP_011871401.1 PREDICTED: homologous-pairing protein 2 homolog [Vollenhovia emeryi]
MAETDVYNCMKIQSKPYSVNDIVTNLYNKYNKSAVEKALNKLVSDGKVLEKVYGKQKIYCVVQESTHDVYEFMRIEKELESHANDFENKYREVAKEVKEQEALLASLKSTLTLEEAQKEKDTLQQSVRQLTHKLDELMESDVSIEDLQKSKRKAQDNLDKYKREYLKRKKMCVEIIDCILQNFSGSKDELYEEIGIDSTTVP